MDPKAVPAALYSAVFLPVPAAVSAARPATADEKAGVQAVYTASLNSTAMPLHPNAKPSARPRRHRGRMDGAYGDHVPPEGGP